MIPGLQEPAEEWEADTCSASFVDGLGAGVGMKGQQKRTWDSPGKNTGAQGLNLGLLHCR